MNVGNVSNILLSLPLEIKLLISSFLSGLDIEQLFLAYKDLMRLSENDEMLWQAFTKREFKKTEKLESETWQQRYFILVERTLIQATSGTSQEVSYALPYPGLPPLSPRLRSVSAPPTYPRSLPFLQRSTAPPIVPVYFAPPDQFRDNRIFMLQAVSRRGLSLKYASERLKDDEDVVMAAVQQNRWAIKFASKRLRVSKKSLMKHRK